ncbi:MAG: hypothetical protein WBG37_14635 [Desulfobacterales bacterium]
MLFYSTALDKTSEIILSRIEAVSPQGKVEICDTLGCLAARLTPSANSTSILILLIRDHQELDSLLALKELLEPYRMILILPDRDPLTQRKAHRLYPRFCTDLDAVREEIGSVIRKMLEDVRYRS